MPGVPLPAIGRLHRALVCGSVIDQDAITVWSRVLLVTGEIVSVDPVDRATQSNARYRVVQSRPVVIEGEALYEVDLERVGAADSSWAGPGGVVRPGRTIQ